MACAAILCILLCLILNQFVLRRDTAGFFGWSDGYICFPAGNDYLLPFTYYYNDVRKLPRPEDIVMVQIPGQDKIGCRLVSSNYREDVKAGYHFCGYYIMFYVEETGDYSFDSLKFTDKNGNESTHRIGNWTFHIIEAVPPPYHTIFSNICATTNGNEYTYEFNIPEGASLISVGYAPDKVIESSENQGGISLTDVSKAPVKIISPSIVLEIDGEYIETCGSICHCGALTDISEWDIELSKAYALEEIPK